MCASRRVPRPSALRRGAAVVSGEGVAWRADARVVRLTARVRELLHTIGRRTSEATVAIGRHLAEIHGRLENGQWIDWIENNVPFSRRTATGYIALAQWADASAADFARLGHVGPTKLMLLAAHPPETIRGLKANKRIDVPGRGKKTIESMTVAELGRVLGDLKTPVPRRPPIGKVVQSAHASVASLRTIADTLVARAREVDPEDAEALRAELAAVLEVLDDAFG